MYLGAALRLAIPFAILDRQDMHKAYGGLGPHAALAKKSCSELRALRGLRPSTFSANQRETARMALLWGEQYLQGYMDAVRGFDRAEFNQAQKQYRQIRAARLKHFGKTLGEVASEGATLVDVTELAQRLNKQHPQLPRQARKCLPW